MTYSIGDFRRDVRQGEFTNLGAYPCFFMTSDGAALSFAAAKAQRRAVLESIRDDSRDGWRITACAVNWEDSALYCDHTGARIPSAYAEPDDASEEADGATYEAAARAAGWDRNAHNGYFVGPIGSETRLADYDSWKELCEVQGIAPDDASEGEA